MDEEPITGKFNVTIGDIVYTAYAENGKLTFDIGYNLTAGNHTINVYYDGDANYLFASKNASFIINTVILSEPLLVNSVSLLNPAFS